MIGKAFRMTGIVSICSWSSACSCFWQNAPWRLIYILQEKLAQEKGPGLIPTFAVTKRRSMDRDLFEIQRSEASSAMQSARVPFPCLTSACVRFARKTLAELKKRVEEDLEETATRMVDQVLELIPPKAMESRETRLQAFRVVPTGAAQFGSDILVCLNKVNDTADLRANGVVLTIL